MIRFTHLLLPVLLTAGLCACQPDTPGTLTLSAALSINAAELDFSEVAVGARRTVELRLHNRGQVGLQLSSTIDPATPAVFQATPASLYVDVGEALPIDVVFAPDRPQPFLATLGFTDAQDAEASASLSLRGTGLLPDCEDHNPCTAERFDLEQLRCVYDPVDGSCDDQRRCTEDDRCVEGACVGQPLRCDDGVGCTIDHCDEVEGCMATPEHSACADSDDPCLIGVCDLERGCLVDLAPDGTLCDEPSCTALSICIQGECRSGPAPDGYPCEDGDRCTQGDACLAGVCVPGAGEGGVISVPIELAPAPSVSSYWPMNPVGVLAVHAPAAGGFEVVWVDYSHWQDVAVQVLRARYDADGTMLSLDQLARAELARAAYAGDDLLLALLGCRDCSSSDPDAPDGGCAWQLRRYPADGGPMLGACLETDGRYVEQLAVGAVDDQVALVLVELDIVNSDRPPGALKVRRFSAALDQLGEEQVEGWTQRPRADHQYFPRSLQLGALEGEPVLAYERAAGVGYEAECGYCTFHLDGCVCGEDPALGCQAPVAFAALSSPRFSPAPIDSVPFHTMSLAMVSRGVGLVPGDARAVASWTERYLGGAVEGGGTICSLDHQVSLHRYDTSAAGVSTRVLAEYAPNQLNEIYGARLASEPAVLALRVDGVLELLAARADATTERLLVPRPRALYGDGPRAYGPTMHASAIWSPGRFSRSAVASLGSGALVVAVTSYDYSGGYDSADDSAGESAGDRDGCSYEECFADEPPLEDRLAVFTIGCGVELTPRQSSDTQP